METLVPLYHKIDVLGLQTLLWDKFGIWASSGSCVEERWNNFKETVSENFECFFPHKKKKKNPGP
jgi:hypothetical protein